MQHALLTLISALLFAYQVSALHPVFPLPFVSLVPLMFALMQTNSLQRRFLLAAIFGMLANSIFVWGSQSFHWLVYPVAVLGLTCQYLLWIFILSPFFSTAPRKRLAFPLYAATAWILCECLFGRLTLVSSGWIAGSLSFDRWWLQSAAFFGPAGLSFFIVYVNALLAVLFVFQKQGQLRMHRSLVIRASWPVVLGLIVAVASAVVPENLERYRDSTMFSVVQGSLTQEQYDNYLAEDHPTKELVLDRYFSLAKKAKAEGSRNVIWPETATRSFRSIEAELQKFFAEFQGYLLGGFPYSVDGVQYNAALFLDRQGEVQGQYFKNNLVAYTEKEFAAGVEAVPVKTVFGKIATPICFELLFADYVRTLVLNGGEAIISLSNDAGFGPQSVASATVLKQSILRAVENRRYLIRAAQSGISAVVSPRGEVLQQTNVFEQTIMPATIRFSSWNTPYTKYGDWFVAAMLFYATFHYLFTPERRASSATTKSRKKTR